MRFLEFFAANIRNPHTRRAYYRALAQIHRPNASMLAVEDSTVARGRRRQRHPPVGYLAKVPAA
jgi:hypothetical protein